MPRWFLLSAAAGFCWAVWAVLSKAMDSAHLSVTQIQILFTVGLLPTGILALVRARPRLAELRSRGGAYGFASGVLGALGNLAFYASLARGGRAAIVIPFTSLYPLVTLVVAWRLMKERVGKLQIAGTVAAIVAVVLLSGEAEALISAAPASDGHATAWLTYASVALVAWGLLSVAQKIATLTISSEMSLVGFCLAFVPIALVMLAGFDWHIGGATVALGILAGAMNGLGMLASFAAYRSGGTASVVTPLAGVLTSLFTVALAMTILAERVGGHEVAGIVVAIVAAAALSREPV
jgi:drug/metabolite transporter (DMT)-like permease